MIYTYKDNPGGENVEQLNFNWTANEEKVVYIAVVKPPLTVYAPAWLAVSVVGCGKAVCGNDGMCELFASARLSFRPGENDSGEQREGTITLADSCAKANVKGMVVRQGPNPAKKDAEEAFDGISKYRTCPQELEAMTEERDLWRGMVEDLPRRGMGHSAASQAV